MPCKCGSIGNKEWSRKEQGSEVEQGRESECVGQWVIFFQGIDIAEINTEYIVSEAGTKGKELTRSVVGRLVEVTCAQGKQVVVPVLSTKPDHDLL